MYGKLIPRLTIGMRIYSISLGLILALLLISITAFWVTKQVNHGFFESKETNDILVGIKQLDKIAGEIHRDTQLYVLTGHESRFDSIQSELKLLHENLNSLEQELEKRLGSQPVSRLKNNFANYVDQLNAASNERKHRDDLILEFNTLRTNLLEESRDSKTKSSLYAMFLKIEGILYRYLSYFDSLEITKATQILDESINFFRENQPLVSKKLGEYKSNLISIVQATRAYLFLVNVVLAAETAEFTYSIKKINEHLTHSIEPLSKQIVENTRRYQFVFVIMAILVFATGSIGSIIVSKSISKPLSEMTTVFANLASDKHSGKIAHLDNQDEVGELARAAEVFRNKNEETRKLLAEARQNREELQQSNDELDQFVYTVSHDLKSPIVTCTGFLGIMKELAQVGKKDEALEKMQIIDEALKRMSQLIKDLLELSRVGRTDLAMAPIDSNSLVAGVVAVHALESKTKKILVSTQSNMPMIYGNEAKITQVVDNLVGNAVKYLPSDGTGRVEIGVVRVEQANRLFVKDNGPGIKPEFHSKVFGLFQRLAPKEIPGTGIGLSIVEKVMKFHNGRVWIDSDGNGTGCIFWAEFPDAPDKGQEQSI